MLCDTSKHINLNQKLFVIYTSLRQSGEILTKHSIIYYLTMHLMLQIQKMMKTVRIPSVLCGEMTKLSVKTKRDMVRNSSVLLV